MEYSFLCQLCCVAKKKRRVLAMRLFIFAGVLVWLSVVFCAVDFEYDSRLTAGSKCETKHGSPGICRLISDCPHQLHTMENFPSEFWPAICGFEGLNSYVCCTDENLRPSRQACRTLEKDLASGKIVLSDAEEYVTEQTTTEVTTATENTTFSDYDTDTATEVLPFPCIFHGFEALNDTHHHMVALGYLNDNNGSYDFLCGGTLISNNYVLTAAHCVASILRDSPNIVWVGVHDLSNQCPASIEGTMVPVVSYTVHPLYKPTSRYHDIALLRIKPIKLGKRALPACLHNALDVPNNMTILGWGSTEIDGGPQSPILQAAFLEPVSQKVCNKSYVNPKYVSAHLKEGITATMVCAKGSDGLADSCQGDSGGPLQVPRDGTLLTNLVGITSFGRLCSGIGVYTRVASYLDWIESIVWPAPK